MMVFYPFKFALDAGVTPWRRSKVVWVLAKATHIHVTSPRMEGVFYTCIPTLTGEALIFLEHAQIFPGSLYFPTTRSRVTEMPGCVAVGPGGRSTKPDWRWRFSQGLSYKNIGIDGLCPLPSYVY